MREPSDMPASFEKLWNARDAKGLADLFSDDASFVNVVGLWWNTRQEIFDAHAYGLRVIFPDSELRVLKVKTRLISDTVAVVNARMMLKGQTAVSTEPHPEVRRNMFTFVMKKSDKRWRCVAAHNTDIVPGAETNVMNASGKLAPADYRDKK